MYEPSTLERLSVYDANGNLVGDSILLGPLDIR
jgi:hypothetical protein